MTDLIKHITNKDFESANKTLEENFKVILEGKLHEMKKMCAATMEQNTHSERQKRLKMDVLEEDDIDEGLLKEVGDKLLKLKSPTARANANAPRPVMRNEEEEQLDEAQVSMVKLRIRGGKVQRRKKVSNVPGMTLRGGKLTRMSPAERRRRKLGAVKAARKTKSKKSQILRKRKLSLMKRSRLGG
jgi:hypothetical protein